MDDNCRGASITESDTVTEYSPGGPEARAKGVARRLIEIPRGITDYTVTIPQHIEGPWGQCKWRNFETQMYVNQRYIGMHHYSQVDGIFFTFPPEERGQPLQEYYRVLCRKTHCKSGTKDLICRHPTQQSQNTSVQYSDIAKGGKTRIDFMLADGPPTLYYRDLQHRYFKKENEADWDYFLTDEEFLAQERQVKY